MMVSQGKKHSLYNASCTRILVVCIILLSSCGSEQQQASNPGFFDKQLVKADSINTADPTLTLPFLDSLYGSFPHPGPIDLFKKYGFISRIYEFQHQYALAKIYADSMIVIIEDHTSLKEYPVYYVKALLAKGLILQREGNYPLALEYCVKARRALENTRDTFSLSESTTILGFIKYKQRKYADAVKYGILAYKEVASCPDSHKKITSLQGKLDDIGIYYTAAGKPDSALHYYNKALDYIRQKENTYTYLSYRSYMEMAKGVIYGNQAEAYYMKGDTAAAEKLYRQSIQINTRKSFDRKDALLTQVKLAGLYIATGQLPQARQVLDELKHSLDTTPHAEILLKWYGQQMQYYAALGQKDVAYDYALPYQKLKDSVNNSAQPQMDMDKEYALIKNHYDLLILQKKTELKNLYLTVTIIVSVLAIFIACLLWLSWKRSKTANTLISRQNDDLQAANGYLEESQKQNTRMMRIVAHDLRNPITSTISITSMMLQNEELQPDDKEMLQLMQASSENSMEMISDLLNINTAHEEIKKQREDVTQLLQYCVNMMQFKAAEKKQSILLAADEVILSINKDKMWRVFSNLIANAIKFSPENATIHIRLTNAQNKVTIEVEDHGMGIPEEMQPKIFDLFTDAKRLGTAGEQSFGLGLNISRQIIEAHNGTIHVTSQAGKGSIFTVILPSN